MFSVSSNLSGVVAAARGRRERLLPQSGAEPDQAGDHYM
jgi:hypothetical protein